MSAKNIIDMLQSFGLTRIQAQILLYLIKMGDSSVSALSNALKTNRMNIYRNLKKMQNMGLVNVIPGKPMKFSVVPPTAAFDVLLSAARNKVLEMESKYTKILEEISRLSSGQQEYTIETRFRIHCGRRNVYGVMMHMLENSEREVCLLTTPADLIRMLFYGFGDVLKKLSEKGVKIKILTNITDKKIATELKDYMKYAMLRHSDIDVRTRFLTVDEKVAFSSLTTDDTMGLESESDSGFWTDSPHYVQSIRAFFEVAWRGAQDASTVLWHLRTGKPIGKMTVFSNIEEYHELLTDIISRAEKEILICIMRMKKPFITENFIENLRSVRARGVNVKILTTIDEETSALEDLLKTADVRHIYAKNIHLSFVTTDAGESLFCFPISFIDEDRFQMLYFWSNSIIFSTILNEYFTDLWLRSLNPSIKLTEIRFKKAIKKIPEILRTAVAEKRWFLEMPATIKGKSGLNQNFDLVFTVNTPIRSLVVGDFLSEDSDVKMMLISLYVKAIDVGASQRLLIVPSSEWLSLEDREMAAAYNIELIEGLEAEELSQKIIEKINNKIR
ncbi:MAG: helix-turn-helix domain-containing protein [Candidatus Bathyarchaeia archaeon]